MGTKKSDCVAMFPESIEKVQKSMPKDCEIDKVVSFFKVLADDTRSTDSVCTKGAGDVCR